MYCLLTRRHKKIVQRQSDPPDRERKLKWNCCQEAVTFTATKDWFVTGLFISLDVRILKKYKAYKKYKPFPKSTKYKTNESIWFSSDLHDFTTVHLHQLTEVLLQEAGVGAPLQQAEQVDWNKQIDNMYEQNPLFLSNNQ